MEDHLSFPDSTVSSPLTQYKPDRSVKHVSRYPGRSARIYIASVIDDRIPNIWSGSRSKQHQDIT